ncbi:hypothetical protein [Bracoviriform demolitoris]|uniref:Uncharacterized protein C3 n=1 Tax=Microplitis demolitor bracovirus (isolate Webb) TaxID=654919 RepID=YC3_MDBVW|nr:hypothetical protein [Microplitis demolitor]YP_239370.1 hypothetical protein [Bracoviriform demolitoris]Q5I158.1 RecName: Full=Uncharacterized protein C3 [Microplitis demolitor bracovirus (isolate Webb)]AAW51772.1 hypothetical protein [Bracoviriform demolitoris]KAG6558384.1 orph-C3 [Microplitis demolitor]
MVLNLIIPQEWNILPCATLQVELLRIIRAKKKSDLTSAGVVGYYNDVVAESMDFFDCLWFRKLEDTSKEPDFHRYSLMIVPMVPSSAADSDDSSSCSECDSDALLSDDGPCSTCDECHDSDRYELSSDC